MQVTLATHELLLLRQTLWCQRYLESLFAVGIQGRREDLIFSKARLAKVGQRWWVLLIFVSKEVFKISVPVLAGDVQATKQRTITFQAVNCLDDLESTFGVCRLKSANEDFLMGSWMDVVLSLMTSLT